MSNWRQTFSENILIPRRLEQRKEDRVNSIYRMLQQTHIDGWLDLRDTPITNLGNLQSVGGSLDLYNTPIQSLGNLQSVGGYLDLRDTPITNLGNLQSVGGWLDLRDTPIAEMSKEQQKEILKNAKVKGRVYIRD